MSGCCTPWHGIVDDSFLTGGLPESVLAALNGLWAGGGDVRTAATSTFFRAASTEPAVPMSGDGGPRILRVGLETLRFSGRSTSGPDDTGVQRAAAAEAGTSEPEVTWWCKDGDEPTPFTT